MPYPPDEVEFMHSITPQRPTTPAIKWYFALSQSTAATYDTHVRAAVRSARRNTTLRPHLLYDGSPDDLTLWMRDQGVKVIHTTVPYVAKMEEARARNYATDVARGAFLRTEIPALDASDDIVLYTDCDVLFLQQPDYAGPCRCFAVAPETDMHDWGVSGMNTGVMFMNLPVLRRAQASFREYIVENFEGSVAFDQGCYRNYFYGQWDRLPAEMNWKPYWGVNPEARILHWHGPKYINAVGMLEGARSWWRYESLFYPNEPAYRQYTALFRQFME